MSNVIDLLAKEPAKRNANKHDSSEKVSKLGNGTLTQAARKKQKEL